MLKLVIETSPGNNIKIDIDEKPVKTHFTTSKLDQNYFTI